MGDKKTYSGIAFTPENHAFLSASGNITQKVNEIIDKVRGGQWLDADTGKEQLRCLYNMRDTTTLDAACPVMARHKELAEKDRLGDLLSCCRQCPRKAEYLLALKQRRGTSAPIAPAAPSKSIVKFTVKCPHCSHEFDSEYFDDRKQPLNDMFHAIASHLKIQHGVESVPPELNVFRVEREKREEMQGA